MSDIKIEAETVLKTPDYTRRAVAKYDAKNSVVITLKFNRGTDADILERLEQEAIERAMQIAGGNVTRAAELLGITRFALYRKLNKS